jgi:hypothetical protein
VIFVQDSISESVEIWDTFNIITMLVRVYRGYWYEFTVVRVDYKTVNSYQQWQHRYYIERIPLCQVRQTILSKEFCK